MPPRASDTVTRVGEACGYEIVRRNRDNSVMRDADGHVLITHCARLKGHKGRHRDAAYMKAKSDRNMARYREAQRKKFSQS